MKVIGPGDVKVTVTETLDAKFIGPGDVIYRGNPRHVEDSGFGPGEVRKD